MAFPARVPVFESGREGGRLFRGLVQCTQCTVRRWEELRWGDVLLLRRDGTVELHCSSCGERRAHRFVRMGR